MRIKALLVALLLALVFGPVAARTDQEMPIFDAHLHYSHDAWEVVPPQGFIDILRKANIRRAMVSSSNNKGTRMLQELAPGVIVPELRPYRSRGELGTWARDPTVIPFVEELLSKRKYVAIGEFHIYGADADLPNMRRIVELARAPASADAAASPPRRRSLVRTPARSEPTTWKPRAARPND